MLGSLCHFRLEDPCAYTSTFPKYLFYDCPADLGTSGYWASSGSLSLWGLPIVFICCFVFHMVTTVQIWEEGSKKLLPITEIFSTDYYNSLLIVPSLTLNKRSAVEDDELPSTSHQYYDNGGYAEEHAGDRRKSKKFKPSPEDKRVRINACATMWHETSEEIQVCLKSVFQMDKYINDRKRDDIGKSEWQKWEWKTHIFFDDCMKKSKTEKVGLKLGVYKSYIYISRVRTVSMTSWWS